jgi:hypothetical protein
MTLYTLIQIDKKTGERTIVYGHVTENVINDYWRTYTDEWHSVSITEYTQVSN